MSRRGENIRKRKDGRWEGRYIKGYDSKKQKARYASVYGKTYAETKQKLDEAKYKSSIGVVYVDAKNKLFGEIINSWFNAKKINLKPSSIIKYQNLIEKHILPELGHRKLRELNADLFYTFLDAQQKNGNKKNGGMLSTSSLQTVNGNSTDLMGPDGKIVLKNYFYISPYNYVSETIELLDDQLIDIQIRYHRIFSLFCQDHYHQCLNQTSKHADWHALLLSFLSSSTNNP